MASAALFTHQKPAKAKYIATPSFSSKRLFWITASHVGLLLWLQSLDLDKAPPQAPTLIVHMLPAAYKETQETTAQIPAPLRSRTKPNLPAQPVQMNPLTRSPRPTADTENVPTAQERSTHTQPELPATQTDPAPVQTVTGVRFDADYLQNPAPAYPTLAKRLREEGKVILRVLVEASGRPGQIELKTSSGSPRLDQAALDAVARWKFVPARRGDEAVDAWVAVPLIFKLKD